VIVKDWSEVDSEENLATWLAKYAVLTEKEHVWRRLSPEFLTQQIRVALN